MELMLLAVEGGGFFSSSATGYSKGLTLLFLGRQPQEDPPMKVSPWNQYHLVDQQTKPPPPDLHLASDTNPVPGGCAAFFCFADAHRHPPLPKVEDEIILEDPIPNSTITSTCDEVRGEVCLKSSLKKLNDCSAHSRDNDEGILGEDDGDNNNPSSGWTGKRKVHWTDSCGQDLVQIREFECSDASDEEFEEENERRCACTIM